MLSRLARGVAPAMAPAARPAVPNMAVRGMAVNLSELRKRITATGNVASLTGVMKLVAASKLKGVETRLEQGRPYGQSLMNSASFKVQIDPDADDFEPTMEPAAEPENHMFLIMTTDRGLCGGVNSQIIRAVKATEKRFTSAGHNVSMFVCGEKGKSGLFRFYNKQFVKVIDAAFDKDATFALAAAIAGEVVEEEYDAVTLIYNTYENAARFALTARQFPKISGLPVGHRPAIYSDWAVEPEDNEEALANLEEYAIAGSIYGALLESQTCEMASRMTAMDSATSNATEMVDRFTLQYNRARQAKITTELVEIISGAESIANLEEDD